MICPEHQRNIEFRHEKHIADAVTALADDGFPIPLNPDLGSKARDGATEWRTMAIAMAKRPTPSRQLHSWSVWHIKGTPATLVGIVHDQPDEPSAIKAAIEEYEVPPNERDHLVALLRGNTPRRPPPRGH